ncbi:hypothetical protein [Acinetobacter ursingii]|uniref:Uncharacterized protein n=1 Tax=Acinetobacter ursingii TaxID=108980 RepID=A0AA46P9D8_9GAMM|nr:hypothetical protein [Acinetobacter ursingii]MCU4608174.1 hypothetical protein [Acinetobacter ursingii]UYF76593.1 hypothetical protein LSO58_06885 [Acinetobacter ursingii]
MNSKVNELQVIEQNAIIVAFQKENGIQDLFDRMAEQARSIVPDVTTKKGRDAIASQAYKVSKSKAAVDNHGKDLVAGIKAQAAAIDRDRKAWRDQCDALRDEIRKPLDDWEQAENDRVAKHQAVIRAIHSLHGENILNKESHEIKGYIFDLENTEIDSSFEEFEQEAKIAKLETLEKLRTALTAREKYEAEQAELERLRQAEIERQQKERDEAIARQAAENARIEAEKKAQAEREQAEKLARESAEREARLKAEHEAAILREEKLKQQAIEQAKQAETQKQQAIEAERLRIEAEQAAKIKADQEAEAARLANKEHMRSINREILNKFCEIGLDEGQAKAVITAIANNQVPHVSVKY